MKKAMVVSTVVVLFLFIISGATQAQLLIKNSGQNELMRVTQSGSIGISTSTPTSRLEIAGGSLTTMPYAYGIPRPAAQYTSLLAHAKTASQTQDWLGIDAVLPALLTDNDYIHIAVHGTLLAGSPADNAISGSLGYSNMYAGSQWTAGVVGHIRQTHNSSLPTTAGLFLQDVGGENNYGIYVHGNSVFRDGYANGNANFDGLVYLGASKKVSLAHYTLSNTFYVSNHQGNMVFQAQTEDASTKYDVDFKCANIRMNGAVVHASDKRWKSDIIPVHAPVDQLMNLQAVQYEWADERDQKKHFGLIAQEVEQVYPDLVSTDENGYKYVNYIELIPLMLKALQEQQKQIEELKR